MSDKKIEIVEAFRDVIERFNDYLELSDTYAMAENVTDYILTYFSMKEDSLKCSQNYLNEEDK